MLRSQSVSNLNDQRKSRSFFSGLRSKKVSSGDLRGDVKKVESMATSGASGYSKDLRDGSITISGPRPLTASHSINHLSKFNTEKTSLPSYSSRQRENKENMEILRGKSSVPNLNFGRNRSPTKGEDDKLKKPLKVVSNDSSISHSQSHRSSLFLGNILSRTTTSLSIHEDSKSDYRRHSMKPSPTESNFDISPDTIHTTDSLMDQASIQIYDFENTIDSLGIDVSDNIDDTTGSLEDGDDDEAADQTLTEKSLPVIEKKPLSDYSIRKMHRTTNLYNIKEFQKLMNMTIEEEDMLPVDNRKSLQVESLERQKLVELLNTSDPTLEDDYSSTLTLVENVYFLTTTSETPSVYPFEEEIDYNHLFKEELYDDESDVTTLESE